MEKLRKWICDRKIEIVCFLLLVLGFYLKLVNAGIATHDELMNLYLVRTQQFFSNFSWERWGTTLMNSLPSYIHALCTNQWTYRIFTVIGLLCSCIAFANILKKGIGENLSWIMLFCFFLFAQMELEHDGLFAFCFSYQLNICFVFISISLYCEYLKNRKKGYLIGSAVLYLLASMAYEAFILYGVLFFLYDLMYWINKKKLSIKVLFKDLVLHASLAIAYSISWFVIGAMIPGTNSDASVGTDIGIKPFVVTCYKLAVGLFPLNYREYTIKEFFQKSFQLSSNNLIRWFFLIIIGLVIAKLVRKAGSISKKKYVGESVICFVGMILPGSLLAMTNKFVDWIYYGGVKSFGVSYYSYFFIIGWLAITFVFIYQRCPLKKIVLVFGTVLIVLVSEFTSINNEKCIQQLSNQQEKIDLFCEVVESDYFAQIEKDAQLYAPDFIGIHNNISTLSEYANFVAGTTISATNDETELDYNNGTVYALSYDSSNHAMYLAKVNKEGYTNEVFVESNQDLNGYGIQASRKQGAGVSELYIDDKLDNVYGDDVITGMIDTTKHYFKISCPDVSFGSFGIYRGNGKYVSAIISTEGIYDQESWGRWAENQCAIKINNMNDRRACKLKLSIAAPGAEDATIDVSNGDYSEGIAIRGRTEAVFDIPLLSGKNTIEIHSSANSLQVENDPRNLNMQIFECTLMYDNVKVSLNNP